MNSLNDIFGAYNPLKADGDTEEKTISSPIHTPDPPSSNLLSSENFSQSVPQPQSVPPSLSSSSISLSSTEVRILRCALRTIEEGVRTALRTLEHLSPEEQARLPASVSHTIDSPALSLSLPSVPSKSPDGGSVVEGVFDGQQMIGEDGKTYAVPPNYASKSKLVEGDMLKLTITPHGAYVFKQIGPIERDRFVGELLEIHPREYVVVVSGKQYKVLLASVTYFRGDSGDSTVILVPKNTPSKWAAVENIIKKTPEDFRLGI